MNQIPVTRYGISGECARCARSQTFACPEEM